MRIAVIGIAACLASATVAAQDTDAPVRAGTPGVSHPRIVQVSSPFYPLIAQSARVQGNVIIEAVVDVTGRVTTTTVTKSIPVLDTAVVDAVRRWQFEPLLVNGRPIRFATTATIQFQLFDAMAPIPLSGTRTFDSGMPVDFAVVYDANCSSVVTLSTARDDLEPVYRALSSAGLLARTEGLRVWEEPPAAAATMTEKGVVMVVAGETPRVCGGSHGPIGTVNSLAVRSSGTWRKLWPPETLSLPSSDYEQQLGPSLALLRRMVDGR